MPRKVTVRLGVAGGPVKDTELQIHELDAVPWGAGATTRVVGTDVPRLEALEKATGRAVYTADVRRPNMAWCALVRSPHAHATVRSVDLTGARATDGCLDVDVLRKPGARVTFAGQGVVAVCADSREALDDALVAVRIEYDVLPTAVTTEDARAPGAPKVDPRRENVAVGRRGRQQRGDADGAMAAAAQRVSGTFRTAVQTHSALEPHGCVVEPDGDGFTVWASTQGTGSIRGSMARALGVPAGKVRVIAEHVGGGFGAKLGGIDAWDAAAARFAKKLRRPVRAMLDRREEHTVAGCRPDSSQELELGCDGKGRLVALRGTVYGTAGNGTGGAGAANSRVYRLPNLSMTQAAVATFTGRARAFRAPGHPQGVFALESAIDMLAEARGEDALELRLRNDPHPVRRVQWQVGAERIDWARKRKVAPGAGRGTVKRGVGCGASIWYQRGRGSYVVDLDLARDGSVVVKNAVQDIGTGTRTLLAVLVAEELGIEPAAVNVRIGDTRHPPGPQSGGSTTAPSIGPAAREAGVRAREALAALLAEEWGCEPAQVAFDGIRFAGPGGKQAGFRDACALLGPDGVSVRGQRRPNYDGYHPETAGCQFAEVAVDVETGVVRVERVVAVHDAGRIVDTLTARSQVVGGVIQGVSYALHEERLLDRRTGGMVNATFDTYRVLGASDCPEIDVVLTSLDSGFNNAGMMGLGEPVTVPTAAAVANAVAHATGARVFELPITPARVLAALERER